VVPTCGLFGVWIFAKNRQLLPAINMDAPTKIKIGIKISELKDNLISNDSVANMLGKCLLIKKASSV
jgi:hypothetical protein